VAALWQACGGAKSYGAAEKSFVLRRCISKTKTYLIGIGKNISLTVDWRTIAIRASHAD
jgi:hypothetical protein